MTKDLSLYSDIRENIEANRFAIMLLMPELEFKRVWSKYNGSISKIASYFNVSEFAASIRANDLNLLHI